ncbi:probable sulfate transporter 3.4 [Tanacetum coccineum]|uniref:Probable sulfate transporter 3.4 n=1 Tax=Tanacetum coccineum TaxID=301880 RepID=A0ABQ5GQ90_9ASTR
MAVDDTKISNIFTTEFILEVRAGSVYISPHPYPASAGLGMLLLLCSLCIFFFGGFLISVPIGLAIAIQRSKKASNVEAPIYFANSTYRQERILRWIREEEWLAANNGSSLICVILDMTGKLRS